MSEKVSIIGKINDIDLFREVCLEHSLELKSNLDIRLYFGSEKCDYGVDLPGRYNLGLKQEQDGKYSFFADKELFDSKHDGAKRGLQGREIIGENGCILFQKYVQKKLARLAVANNMTVGVVSDINNNLVLEVRSA